jgi:hypothetical protein
MYEYALTLILCSLAKLKKGGCNFATPWWFNRSESKVSVKYLQPPMPEMPPMKFVYRRGDNGFIYAIKYAMDKIGQSCTRQEIIQEIQSKDFPAERFLKRNIASKVTARTLVTFAKVQHINNIRKYVRKNWQQDHTAMAVDESTVAQTKLQVDENMSEGEQKESNESLEDELSDFEGSDVSEDFDNLEDVEMDYNSEDFDEMDDEMDEEEDTVDD